MNLYLLTSGILEKSIDMFYPSVQFAKCFTNLKQAKKEFTRIKQELEKMQFVEIETATLTETAAEMLRYDLKTANNKQHVLISAFDDCYQWNSIKYYDIR